MLTSTNPSNQYLRPEYLSPLPTTLDAKNSPLALLAQTCSSIGADTTPNPKLLANIEKSTKSLSNSSSSSSSMNGLNLSKTNGGGGGHANHTSMDRDKLSPGSSVHSNSSSSDVPKSSFKPYEMTMNGSSGSHHHKSDEPQQQPQRSASTKSTKHQLHRSESNQSANSQRASPIATSHPKQQTSPHLLNGSTVSPPPRASSKDSGFSLENSSTTTSSSAASKLAGISAENAAKEMPPYHPLTHQSPFLSSGFPSSAALAASAYLNGAAASAGYSPYAMDMAMAHHQQMMKAAAMNPYFSSYPMSRLKVPGLMEAHHPLMQMCRDPYCTGCALSNHHRSMMAAKGAAGNGSACPIGCTQCDHVPTSAAMIASSAAASSAAMTTTTNSSSSKMSPYPSVSQSSAAYAHAQLSALHAASQLPFVCNWIATDASYCGKRFGTSDDLLQHLRTHTSNMSESMLTTAAATGLPPTHPLLQRTYPTPPLSPLSTARYHPYGKPPSLLPPSLQPPPPPGSGGYNPLTGLPPGIAPHPSLAQYFSPFSLYGIPRLGPPHSMHQ